MITLSQELQTQADRLIVPAALCDVPKVAIPQPLSLSNDLFTTEGLSLRRPESVANGIHDDRRRKSTPRLPDSLVHR